MKQHDSNRRNWFVKITFNYGFYLDFSNFWVRLKTDKTTCLRFNALILNIEKTFVRSYIMKNLFLLRSLKPMQRIFDKSMKLKFYSTSWKYKLLPSGWLAWLVNLSKLKWTSCYSRYSQKRFEGVNGLYRLHRCYWQVDVGDFILVTSFGCWGRTLLLNDRRCWWQKRPNRHQHLKVVANTFRLQHPSPTSM